MGKGPSRKPGDQPRIKMAETVQYINSTGKSGKAFTADQCLVTFQAKVEKSALTAQDIRVRLETVGERYAIMIGGNKIGSLNIQQSKMVAECQELGIRYTGKIVIENNTIYARFKRIN